MLASSSSSSSSSSFIIKPQPVQSAQSPQQSHQQPLPFSSSFANLPNTYPPASLNAPYYSYAFPFPQDQGDYPPITSDMHTSNLQPNPNQSTSMHHEELSATTPTATATATANVFNLQQPPPPPPPPPQSQPMSAQPSTPQSLPSSTKRKRKKQVAIPTLEDKQPGVGDTGVGIGVLLEDEGHTDETEAKRTKEPVETSGQARVQTESKELAAAKV